MTLTAEHRPATRKRRFRHDDLTALDMFSGFGGLTLGIKRAGFTTILAANHLTPGEAVAIAAVLEAHPTTPERGESDVLVQG